LHKTTKGREKWGREEKVTPREQSYKKGKEWYTRQILMLYQMIYRDFIEGGSLLLYVHILLVIVKIQSAS